jgi:hypothetical protein
MTLARALVLSFVAALSVGCPKSETKSDDKSSSADKKKDDDKPTKKDESGDDDDKKTDDDKGDDKKDDDKGDDKKGGDDAPTTIERSKAPSVAEWNAGDTIDAGDDDVGCEVKGVREWVRVSCRKNSPGGGTPTDVQVLHGKSKETFVFVGAGVTSVVAPVIPGTDIEARFSWSDVVYHVDLYWPKGKAKPKTLVDFDKTDEAPTAPVGQKTCDCYKAQHPGGVCKDSDEGWTITSVNPYCESTYASDCEKLIECAHGEPGVSVKCPDGMVLAGMGQSCEPSCNGGKCPDGLTCVDGQMAAQGHKVCEEP